MCDQMVMGPQATCKWMPSEDGLYKANCDVSINRSKRRIGIGIVIRDHKGRVMASCSQSLNVNLSLKAAKLTAVLKSILFSLDYGLASSSFGLDEACIVKWILDCSYRESVFGLILEDIDSLVSMASGMIFTHADKKANRVAQGLARYATESSDDTY
ncbi:hypothetical protein Ddye_026375 [Dipteronia dyeriana]|uniref:RNase H type-1 domain-containing protein n=1 Tax=Dipteronia dyeriana TaxID=168575 RepID=A0AAD9WQH5_9ROSI|nr:hypothetical protein Ddye_026375 [Dipteronia dyeriana]